MSLSYKPASGKEASVSASIIALSPNLSTLVPEVIIPFNPPLLGYEEVKPRLIQMKTEAEEGIGMASMATNRQLPPLIPLFLD